MNCHADKKHESNVLLSHSDFTYFFKKANNVTIYLVSDAIKPADPTQNLWLTSQKSISIYMPYTEFAMLCFFCGSKGNTLRENIKSQSLKAKRLNQKKFKVKKSFFQMKLKYKYRRHKQKCYILTSYWQ